MILEDLIMEHILVDERMDYLDEKLEKILEKTQMVRAQAASDFCANFRKAINNPEYSDVIFVCKDGATVYACRTFLVTQSAVLHSMLLNGMEGTQLSKITLHEISSAAFLPVMEFLYTGTVQEHAPKDWKNAYEIIHAARFFLLERLEFMVVDYLLLVAEELRGDIEAAATFLSIAVEFVDIFGENVELITRELVCILDSTSLEPEHLQALTGKAFLYFLEKTRTENAEPEFVSEAEFLRLKSIISWCACQELTSKETLMHHVPSGIASMPELLEKAPGQQKIVAWENSEAFESIRTGLALSVRQYLPLVDLRRIPPRLLVDIVEPMDIIPSSALMDAFRFHALRPSLEIEEFKETLGWLTGRQSRINFRISKDGFRIQQMVPRVGFARYNLDFYYSKRDKIFEWEITIEDVCDDFIEVGIYYEDCNPKDGRCLSDQPGGWALRMDRYGLSINRRKSGRLYSGDPKFVYYGKDFSQLVYGKDYAHKNSKINISFDAFEGNCSFSVDDEDFGVAWTNIPHGSFSPAVSLGTGSSGKVRIRILHH